MNTYFITAAIEEDGHAGSLSSFFKTEDELKRPQILLALTQMFQEDGAQVSFVESKSSVERNDPSSYYGEIVSVIDYNGEAITDRTAVSITVAKLPSRIIKNKVYMLYTRTG
jgi:hypothetical protein